MSELSEFKSQVRISDKTEKSDISGSEIYHSPKCPICVICPKLDLDSHFPTLRKHCTTICVSSIVKTNSCLSRIKVWQKFGKCPFCPYPQSFLFETLSLPEKPPLEGNKGNGRNGRNDEVPKRIWNFRTVRFWNGARCAPLRTAECSTERPIRRNGNEYLY